MLARVVSGYLGKCEWPVTINAKVNAVDLVPQAPVDEPSPLLISPKLSSKPNMDGAIIRIPGEGHINIAIWNFWIVFNLQEREAHFRLRLAQHLNQCLDAIERSLSGATYDYDLRTADPENVSL